MPRIAIIVGEASGDQLARGLIEAFRVRFPEAEFVGITGPKMRAAGCESWGDYEQLALMGLVEVVRHVPRLKALMRDLKKRLAADPPDVFIGVDAPDFNLPMERFAHDVGIPTVHYGCPTVWAWRQGRVKTIRASCDMVLCLLPFEAGFLTEHNVPARFVGHPLAEEIGAGIPREECRDALGIPADDTVVALLPGSRGTEITQLGPPFLEAVQLLRQRKPRLRFIAAAASSATAAQFASLCASAGLADVIDIREGMVREILGSADVVLLSSGTATLETMLMRRPMVVAYKVGRMTMGILRFFKLLRLTWIAYPNLLAGETLVPEFLQEQVTGEALGEAVDDLLNSPERRAALAARFDELSAILSCSASEQAADAVAALLNQSPNQRPNVD